MEKKFVCLLYRTKTTEQENQAEMERQRGACLQFAQEQGWESSGVQKKTAVRWMRIRFWNCEPVQRRLNFRFYWFQSLTVSDASHWNAVQPQPFLSDMVLRYGQ